MDDMISKLINIIRKLAGGVVQITSKKCEYYFQSVLYDFIVLNQGNQRIALSHLDRLENLAP